MSIPGSTTRLDPVATGSGTAPRAAAPVLGAAGSIISQMIADGAITDAKIASSEGLGTYLRTIKRYTPSGDSTDAAAITALVAEMTGVGEVRVGSGTALITEPIVLDNDLVFTMHPGTVLHSTMSYSALTGDDSNSVLLCNRFASGITTTTTLSVALTPGATSATLTSASGIAIGDTIVIMDQGQNRRVSYIVKNVVGSVVTLDRPYAWDTNMAVSSVVWKFRQLQNLTIEGNGATITGSGDRAISLVAARNTHVRNVRVDGPFQHYVVSFDIGGCFNSAEDVHVDCNSQSGSSGIALESQESSALIRCTGTRAAGDGIRLVTSVACVVRDCRGYKNAGHGLQFTTNGDADEISGVRFSLVDGGEFSGNAGSGVVLTEASSYNSVRDAWAVGNAAAGFRTAEVVARPINDNTFRNCSAWNNATYGFQLEKRVYLESVFAKGNTNAGIQVGGTVIHRGGTIEDGANGYPCVDVPGAYYYEAVGVNYRVNHNGYCEAVQAYGSGAEVHLRDCVGTWVNSTNGAVLSLNGNGVGYVDGCKKSGGSGPGVYVNASTDVCYVAANDQLASYSGAGLVVFSEHRGRTAVAMADTNQTLTPTQYRSEFLECTGAQTAKRDVVLPPVTGRIVTIKNSTTGGFAVRAIGSSGTGTDIAAGSVGRVVWDGTNMVAA